MYNLQDNELQNSIFQLLSIYFQLKIKGIQMSHIPSPIDSSESECFRFNEKYLRERINFSFQRTTHRLQYVLNSQKSWQKSVELSPRVSSVHTAKWLSEQQIASN